MTACSVYFLCPFRVFLLISMYNSNVTVDKEVTICHQVETNSITMPDLQSSTLKQKWHAQRSATRIMRSARESHLRLTTRPFEKRLKINSDAIVDKRTVRRLGSPRSLDDRVTGAAS